MSRRRTLRSLTVLFGVVALLGTSPAAQAHSASSRITVERGTPALYTIAVDGGTTNVPTYTEVTVAVSAVDPDGNPIPGLAVTFSRDSDPYNTPTINTDANGVASYAFQPYGVQCGTADYVTAVVRDGDTIVSTLNIAIHYAACEPPDAALTGRSSKDGKLDVLKVTASTPGGTGPLKGSPVSLKAKIDGVWANVGPGDQGLNARGRVRIEVRDRNGDRVTKYRATIEEPGAYVLTNVARLR